MIDTVKLLTAAAVGGAGAATGTIRSKPITGKIHAVHLRYIGSPPASSEIVLQDAGTYASENQIILDIVGDTDTWIYPRQLVRTNGNGDVTYDGANPVYEHFVVADHLDLTLTLANVDDQVEAIVFFER